MARKWIRNDQWKRIKDLLPGKPNDTGARAIDNRLFLEAVLWIARTGSPWRDLPPEFGNWHATFTRFSRWRRKGVWQHVIDTISGDAELQGLLLIKSALARPRYGTVDRSKGRDLHADAHAMI